MKRLILKYHLKNRDEFEARMNSIGVEYSEIFWLHDRVYIPKDYRKKQNFLRLVVRTEMRAVDRPPKYFLIAKRHIEDSGIDIVEETQVSDYTGTVRMINELGFDLKMEVSRRRVEAKTREGDNFYIDKIDGVSGYYAKIERDIDDDAKIFSERSRLENLMEEIEPGTRVYDPYFEIPSNI